MLDLKGVEDIPVYWYNEGEESLTRIIAPQMKQEIVNQVPSIRSFASAMVVIVCQTHSDLVAKCTPNSTMIQTRFRDKSASVLLLMEEQYDGVVTIQTTSSADFLVVCKNGGVNVQLCQKESV